MAREVPLAGVDVDRGGGPLTDVDPCKIQRASSNDNGLKRMLIWTLAALIVSLVMAFIGVTLAIRFFDRP
jgi:hypothetical protein